MMLGEMTPEEVLKQTTEQSEYEFKIELLSENSIRSVSRLGESKKVLPIDLQGRK